MDDLKQLQSFLILTGKVGEITGGLYEAISQLNLGVAEYCAARMGVNLSTGLTPGDYITRLRLVVRSLIWVSDKIDALADWLEEVKNDP